MHSLSQLERFRPHLTALGGAATRLTALPDSLRMARDGRFEVFYAPFDYINQNAKIVVVGITPGLSQAVKAIDTAVRLLRAGFKADDVTRQAKLAASFAGAIRTQLVSLLDHVGVNGKLGILSTSELWGVQSGLAHFTSALRYPVFDKGRNYTGTGITCHALLVEQIDTWFAAECRALPHALFVPLGNAADAACDRMIQQGLLQEGRVLSGLPHPSPANMERIAYFLGRKSASRLSIKTNGPQLDRRREMLLAKVAAASFGAA